MGHLSLTSDHGENPGDGDLLGYRHSVEQGLEAPN